MATHSQQMGVLATGAHLRYWYKNTCLLVQHKNTCLLVQKYKY
jgi:hypothetical protein